MAFNYKKRAQKENLIVRWSHKRRDRVDQVLVRELHAEEASWTDYQGTIHILRKHLYSTKLNLTSKFFTRTGVFFVKTKDFSFSTLHFDIIFMLFFS